MLPEMQNARETALRTDRSYINLLEAESTWPFKYAFSRPNPVDPRRTPMWGQVPGVPSRQVDLESRLQPVHFRVQTRAAHNKPQTELFGTAPYTALGRGQLKYVDIASLLQQGNLVSSRGSKTLCELDLWRYDFVSLPPELRNLPFDSRLSQATRLGPDYLQPHDD